MARSESGLGAVGGLVLGGLALVVALVVLRTVFGMAMGVGDESDGPAVATPESIAPSESTAPRSSTVPPPSTAPATSGDTGPPAARAGVMTTVELRPSDTDRFTPGSPAVGDLTDGGVLGLHLSGFAADTTGLLQQCVYAGGRPRCGRSFPVNFDGDGRARVQYQVTQAVAPELTSCAGYVHPCFVSVTDVEGQRALVMTVFGGPMPERGRIAVTPVGGLAKGDEVEVRVSGYPPGALVYAVQCSSSEGWGSETCTDPDPDAAMTVGADGTAQTVVAVMEGRLGTDGRSCRSDAGCVISVGSDDVWTRAALVPLGFAGAGGASYDFGRAAAAIAISLAFLAAALWLWRTTDWASPSEAATPEMDAARFD